MQVKQDVAAAKALHEEASALPIRDTALLATLQDASTTYCLCGLPQKVPDAMTACSSCGALYHLACLGIAREKEPKRLICPVCAGRAGQRFVWAVRAPVVSVSTGFVICHSAPPQHSMCPAVGRQLLLRQRDCCLP